MHCFLKTPHLKRRQGSLVFTALWIHWALLSVPLLRFYFCYIFPAGTKRSFSSHLSPGLFPCCWFTLSKKRERPLQPLAGAISFHSSGTGASPQQIIRNWLQVFCSSPCSTVRIFFFC